MAATEAPQLIAGLGNPGSSYAQTRHNVGFWLLDRLAVAGGGSFRPETRFHGQLCEVSLGGRRLRLLKPDTYVNLSGRAVAAVLHFYRLPPAALLVVHDDLDLPAGSVRCKVGGGHGGHNGLRDIVGQIGSQDFVRLRLGIGHPGERDAVTGHVLGRPDAGDRAAIETALDAVLGVLPRLLDGDWQAVMQALHGRDKP